MARGINKVFLIGNLGDDPTIRTTASGINVANISMVTNEQHKNTQTGQVEETAQWHRVVLWGKTAEIAKKYLKKGSQIFIEGKIQTNSFTDKNGVKRYSTEIIAEQMQMLGYRYSTDESNGSKISNDGYASDCENKPYIPQEEQPQNYFDENFDFKNVSTTIDTEIPF